MPANQYRRMQCSNRAPPRQPDQSEDDDQDAISSNKGEGSSEEPSEEESDGAETSEREVEPVEEAVRLFQIKVNVFPKQWTIVVLGVPLTMTIRKLLEICEERCGAIDASWKVLFNGRCLDRDATLAGSGVREDIEEFHVVDSDWEKAILKELL